MKYLTLRSLVMLLIMIDLSLSLNHSSISTSRAQAFQLIARYLLISSIILSILFSQKTFK